MRGGAATHRTYNGLRGGGSGPPLDGISRQCELESLERRLDRPPLQSPGGTVHAVARVSSANAAAPHARNGESGGASGGGAEKKHHRKARESERASTGRHYRRKATGPSERLAQMEPTVTFTCM